MDDDYFSIEAILAENQVAYSSFIYYLVLLIVHNRKYNVHSK